MQQPIAPQQQADETVETSGLSRRRFMQYAGGLAGASVLLAACSKNNNDLPDTSIPGVNKDGSVRLGSGDVGLLNYFYALKQMEAAFYISVIASPYQDITADESQLLTDMRDHKVAQREFYKKMLGSNAIPAVQTDFSSVNFATRAGVVTAAKALEDLIVAAYNGGGVLFASGDTLLYIAKIGSVAARHAAFIRDTMGYGSFADTTAVDANGLDLASTPNDTLTVVGNYLKTKLVTDNLPKA